MAGGGGTGALRISEITDAQLDPASRPTTEPGFGVGNNMEHVDEGRQHAVSQDSSMDLETPSTSQEASQFVVQGDVAMDDSIASHLSMLGEDSAKPHGRHRVSGLRTTLLGSDYSS
jgi:hypothetical protein